MHPNIVLAYGIFVVDGRVGLLLELAEMSVSQWLREKIIFHTERKAAIVHISRAVDGLHQHRICHCDLKPANFLKVGDAFKVADLGLAATFGTTVHGSSVYTASYRAPELRGEQRREADHDRFALGCSLAEMVLQGPQGQPFKLLPTEASRSVDSLNTYMYLERRLANAGNQDAHVMRVLRSLVCPPPRSKTVCKDLTASLSMTAVGRF